MRLSRLSAVPVVLGLAFVVTTSTALTPIPTYEPAVHVRTASPTPYERFVAMLETMVEIAERNAHDRQALAKALDAFAEANRGEAQALLEAFLSDPQPELMEALQARLMKLAARVEKLASEHGYVEEALMVAMQVVMEPPATPGDPWPDEKIEPDPYPVEPPPMEDQPWEPEPEPARGPAWSADDAAAFDTLLGHASELATLAAAAGSDVGAAQDAVERYLLANGLTVQALVEIGEAFAARMDEQPEGFEPFFLERQHAVEAFMTTMERIHPEVLSYVETLFG